MKCSCPKCSAILPEELAQVSDKGKQAKCPSCGQHYWIQRESFALRAYAVDGRRYCVQCGVDIQTGSHCPGCGTPCPEYCIVQPKKLVRRKAAASGFSWGIAGGGARGKRKSLALGAGSVAPSESRTGSAFSFSPLAIKGILVLAVLAVIAGAAFLYLGRQKERDFTQHYVFALYVVKAGCEQNLKMSTLLANGTRLGEKELTELSKAKMHIDDAMQKLNPVPGEYVASHQRLQALYNIYGKFYTLCTTSGPSPLVADTAKQLDTEFSQAAKGLKASMPPELVDALKGAVPKYRNLGFLVE